MCNYVAYKRFINFVLSPVHTSNMSKQQATCSIRHSTCRTAPSTPATCRSNMSKQQATCDIRRSTCRKKLNMFNLFRHVERMKKSFDMLPKTATCRTATFDMLLRHVAAVDRALYIYLLNTCLTY